MKIDLFKLNNFNRLELDDDIFFGKEIYENTDIRDIKDVHIDGVLEITYEDELVMNACIKGTFILPCAVTLDDVSYQFELRIDENLGKFEDFYNKSKNTLDILPILWENVVLEVPIRVVKDGITSDSIISSGDGWELVSDD